MAMPPTNRSGDDSSTVLPFETSETDVHEGIGRIETIVDLLDHRGDGREILAAGQHTITSDGRCNQCGYDRGRMKRHTEVPGFSIDCDHCGTRLVEEGPR